ncbi:MAG: 50S ribosome-binding GTPase [Deltaproteobacteria bacterium]|nr:50S ribosome-binding GTPase [Deltaproteobacteria bacterium]
MSRAERGSGIEARFIDDPLELLLSKAHRDEIEPLAELLGVPHREMGIGLVARNCARITRRLATHGIANAALRGGEGPPYAEVLAGIGARQALDGEFEAAELQLVRGAAAAAWARLRAEDRRQLWNDFGLAGEPVPGDGATAMARAEAALGEVNFGYRITNARLPPGNTAAISIFAVFMLSPAGCVLRPFMIPFFPLFAWWAFRPDPARLGVAVMHVARLRQLVTRRVTIGFVGSPSTGKDAGIRALFGMDSGNISPVAGSTTKVSIQRVPGATALYVVNTPGLGDVVESVTDEAKQVLGHIDVYIYVVNANGGVQEREQADYRACVSSGKPVLAVVNKIDTIESEDALPRLLEHAQKALGAPADSFLPVAFDPLPQLADAPVGLDAVRAWLRARLVDAGKEPSEIPIFGASSPASGG